MTAGEQRGKRQQDALRCGDDIERLGHAAGAGLAGLGHLAGRAGPTKRMPSRRSVSTLRRVAGWAHMAGFMAGRQQHRRAGGEQDGRGEIVARPVAIFAIRSAVAGATTISAASRARRMWPTSCSSSRSKRSVKTVPPVSAPTESGVTNSCAASGHDRAHGVAALAQAADQVERLVGGDAAADDKEDRGGAGLDGRRLRSAACGWRCRGGGGCRQLTGTKSAAQDGAHLLFHGDVVLGRGQPQAAAGGGIEAADREGGNGFGHCGSLDHDCNDCNAVQTHTPGTARGLPDFRQWPRSPPRRRRSAPCRQPSCR